ARAPEPSHANARGAGALAPGGSADGSTMIAPPRLRPGDRIGIVAPSGPVLKRYVVAGLRVLEAAGFRPRLARHLYDRRGHLAGTDEARAADLNRMLR